MSINEYNPDYVTLPGDTLRDLLEQYGMSQSELAKRMGRPHKTINEIIHGRTEITPDTALQLEKVFGASAQFWLNREMRYQEGLARMRNSKALAGQISWLKNFPINAMKKDGLLPDVKDKQELLVALLRFFEIAEPASWELIWESPLVNYRKSEVFESDDYALSVWLQQGELQARDLDLAAYDAKAFKALLKTELRHFTATAHTDPNFAQTLRQKCAEVGVGVVYVPQIGKARVSGVTRWLDKDNPLIQLSLRYKTNDHFWFTFFHEAGHVLLHGKTSVYINDPEHTTDVEDEANAYAANLLIPRGAYNGFVKQYYPYISKAAVIEFAKIMNIAPGIVVGRLQHEGHLKKQNLNGLKRKFEWTTKQE